ncbi:Tetratricopeptide repeat protein [Pseudobythopirellula maris]|uniref:Tetratricopeptide repeat protein n=1 Tax=Pseudobythopirellula maris TaxID=2527991 RepID=A0A5C5ZJF1_9BACT|nr:tetratricopeptide repeat protein [Pseudobythopirellula maris]TWT87512.1 Tetratricopeptide repeat protein [Pseudobythopirellula maris]
MADSVLRTKRQESGNAAKPQGDQTQTGRKDSSRARQGRMVLNTRQVVVTVVLIVVGMPLLHLLHGYQVHRTADAFLRRAAELEREGNHRLAAEYVDRYRRLRPQETEVVIELARAYDRSADSPSAKNRATQYYYQALGVAGERPELKLALNLRLAELLLEASRVDNALLAKSAEESARLSAGSASPEVARRAWRVIALSQYLQTTTGGVPAALPDAEGTIGAEAAGMSVGECLVRAFELQPHDLQLASLIANDVNRMPDRYKTLLGPEHGADEEPQLAQEADHVIETFIRTRRERLAETLTRIGAAGVLPAGPDLSEAYESTLAAIQTPGDGTTQLSRGAKLCLAERAAEEFRSGASSWLRSAALEAFPQGADSMRAPLAVDPLDDDLATELADWLIAEDDEAIERLLAAPLMALNQEYGEALVAEYDYRLRNDLPVASEKLLAAVAHLPDAPPTLLAAGHYFTKQAQSAKAQAAQSQQAQSHPTTDHSVGAPQGVGSPGAGKEFATQAERLLRHAMEEAPRDERPFILLGELMLTCPDLFATQGTGRVIVAEEAAFQAGADRSVLLHFEGEDNDVLVESTDEDRPIRYVVLERGAGQATARFDASRNTIRVQTPRDGMLANDLVELLRTIDSLSVSHDGSIDHAVAIWRAGLRATQGKSLRISLLLAETWASRQQTAAAESALADFDQALESARSFSSTPADVAELVNRRTMLEAQIALKSDHNGTGVQKLEAMLVDANAKGDAAALRKVWLALTDAYSAGSNWGKAAKAAEEAAVLTPNDASYRTRAGLLWARAGNYQRSAGQYRRAQDIEDNAEARLALSRVLFEQQHAKPNRDRDWTEFDLAFESLRESAKQGELEDPWRYELLYVDSMLEKAGDDRGQEVVERILSGLRGVEKRNADSVALLRRLTFVYEDLGATADTDRAIELWGKASEEPVGTIAVALRHAEVLQARDQGEAARKVLQIAIASSPARHAQPLKNALMRVEMLSGETGLVRDRLLQDYDKDPANAETLVKLTRLAMAAKQQEEADRWFGELKKLLGEGDARVLYVEAERLLSQGEKLSEEELGRAKGLLESALADRPLWNAPRWMLVQLAMRNGDHDSAVADCEKLLASGARSLPVYEILTALRCRRGEFDKAERLLVEAKSLGFESEKLGTIQTLVAAGVGNVDEAIARSRAAAMAAPDDASLCHQYGQLLAASQDRSEKVLAVKAFQRCIRLDPEGLEHWCALVVQHARLGAVEKAREAIEQLQENLAPGTPGLAESLSRSFEVIGDLGAAEEQCRIALEAEPDDMAVRLRLASLVGRHDLAEAESIAREVLAEAPEYGPARRFLAALLGSLDDTASVDEAMSLLQGAEESSADEVRLKAQLLVKRGGDERRREARQAIESIAASDGEMSSSDRLALASLYESEGRFNDARREYLALVERSRPQIKHLSLYAKMLVRRQDYQEAESVLERLEELSPLAPETAETTVFSMTSRGKRREAADYLNGFVERVKESEGVNTHALAKWAADLCTVLRLHAAAEPYFRELHRLDPASYEGLALCLSQQQKVDEAVDLCLESVGEGTPQGAIALCAVLQTGKASVEHYQRVRPYLNEAERRFPDSTKLHLMLANMRLVLGDQDEAIRLYRKTIQIDPQNLLALNNLASMLSEHDESRAESIELVDRALEAADAQGASPAVEALLADTKGSALLYRGQHDQALELFRHATTLGPREAVYQLHLAAAFQRKDDLQSARLAFESAQRMGVEGLVLSQADRELIRQLQ